ncbi:type III secretion protein [Rhizobiales bacterium RZME27]|uniref:Type III secretion protein n=1 Tax=Endobacterium cereale TaxID=2663029 RepID=A0A6A8AKL9_9HYPH|nr:secretin N-terminal domain-containing protein [Endobacterium cereale]MEB2847433.1 secretin N-terminal domain-containing protein [Endobacterium cereale]MQY49281.1 type III secretion protein [Endobacterium cereale]
MIFRFAHVSALKSSAASNGPRSRPASGAALALLLAVGVALASTAEAAPAWSDSPYNYVVLDQDVRVALTEFGRNVGLPVVLSDAVNGRVRGRIEAKSAGEFIDRLAATNGLVWYFDGSVLHVSADREFVTRVIDAGRLRGDVVANEMRDLGLADERFSLRAARNGNVITVSGPPAYINVVNQLVERLQPEPVVAGDDPRVRVFRGGVMTEMVSTGPADSAPSGQRQENAARK